ESSLHHAAGGSGRGREGLPSESGLSVSLPQQRPHRVRQRAEGGEGNRGPAAQLVLMNSVRMWGNESCLRAGFLGGFPSVPEAGTNAGSQARVLAPRRYTQARHCAQTTYGRASLLWMGREHGNLRAVQPERVLRGSARGGEARRQDGGGLRGRAAHLPGGPG